MDDEILFTVLDTGSRDKAGVLRSLIMQASNNGIVSEKTFRRLARELQVDFLPDLMTEGELRVPKGVLRPNGLAQYAFAIGRKLKKNFVAAFTRLREFKKFLLELVQVGVLDTADLRPEGVQQGRGEKPQQFVRQSHRTPFQPRFA